MSDVKVANINFTEVTAKDLPLHCPTDAVAVWSSHPRVFLDITVTGQVGCPYCGTKYRLKAGEQVNHLKLGIKMEPAWKIYEDAARKVLTDLRKELGIQTVEGKQTLTGVTNWEIDAKAWCEDSDNFLVIEVRRHTKSGLTQEALAAIAYRIQDVGGSGGVIVSPRQLQKGAKLIATNAKISHIKLTPESTTESYLAEFMGRRFLGATIADSVQATDTCDAVVIRGTPNP